MINLDTLTLKCFLEVAATGSFTKAAARLCRTQSAISQQMAKLENHLGKELINRGKKLTLTPEGEILQQYARQMVALHLEALDRLQQPELEGEVRLGLPEDFAAVFLSEILLNFTQAHPRILLNIECDLTVNLLEHFQKDEFDLVLVKMNHTEDFPNGVKIWSQKLEWVGNKNLVPTQADQLLPLVLSPHPCVYRARAIRSLEDSQIRWRLALSTVSHASKIAAVKAGLGLTVLPTIAIPEPLEALHLTTLPLLDNTQVSLLKKGSGNPAIKTVEAFILDKLHQST